ncbi:MAG TPA: STAS domain-containing protein [Acidimicrobiia bacterium]|nr:STAS domain-containing protein [Acidimicrobiia bacterium]
MIAPVYRPQSQVDSRNIASFREAVADSAARYGRVVIDCSCVLMMGVSAMRVLELASRDAHVTLVNPNPAIRLMATAFGVEIEMQRDE